MSECILITPELDKPTVENLIRKFVECELCPCAKETFIAEMIHRDIKEALYRAVVNEMVLRAMAEKVSE